MAECKSRSEEDLANALRKLCFASGREREPAQSAKVIHEMGLVYKGRSPDKICLIQSAVLLNAARVRLPDDDKILCDLHQLCVDILEMAKANNKTIDLLDQGKMVKKKLEAMRKQVEEDLSNIPIIHDNGDSKTQQELEEQKILKIGSLQEYIANTYTKIMHDVSMLCKTILGDPPNKTKYALVGMGSLARTEITPFSDFENFIIFDENVKHFNKEKQEVINEYFRWFSVIFQVILINIGETIIPNVAIPTLNNFDLPQGNWFYDAYTTCGVSFDSMVSHACKFPIGRTHFTSKKPWKTELIKSVSDMLHYLDTEEDLKNGYHLADMLTKTCFVEGDLSLYDDFDNGVKAKVEQQRSNKDFLKQIQKQLEENYDKFHIADKITTLHEKPYNVKSMLYRSISIFLSALGTVYGLNASSSFDIVKALEERKIITNIDKHKLAYAVSIALEVRLKLYAFQQGQDDLVGRRVYSLQNNAPIVEAVGSKSAMDYFVTTNQFQNSIFPFESILVSRSLELCWNDHSFLSIEIAWVLRLPDFCLKHSIDSLKHMVDTKNYNYDAFRLPLLVVQGLDQHNKHTEFIQEMRKELQLREEAAETFPLDKKSTHCLYRIGYVLRIFKRNLEALAVFRRLLDMRISISFDKTVDLRVAGDHYHIGMCLKVERQFEEAQKHFISSLEIRKRVSKDLTVDMDIANVSFHLGECYSGVRKFDQALECFQTTLSILERTSEDESNDIRLKSLKTKIVDTKMEREK